MSTVNSAAEPNEPPSGVVPASRRRRGVHQGRRAIATRFLPTGGFSQRPQKAVTGITSRSYALTFPGLISCRRSRQTTNHASMPTMSR